MKDQKLGIGCYWNLIPKDPNGPVITFSKEPRRYLGKRSRKHEAWIKILKKRVKIKSQSAGGQVSNRDS